MAGMSLTLAHSLRIKPDSCVAFIGAGGKTTAMIKLARELQPTVIVTATTHLGAWQTGFADKHISTDASSLEKIEDKFQGILLVTGILDGNRTKPLNKILLHWLHRYCKEHSIPLLIEADGSRQKPLKAWAEHEPPIPDFVDLVVQVTGLSGLKKPLTDENVHRVDIFSKLSGLNMGETITPNAVVSVLTHPNGGLKNMPVTARKVVLLNQADIPDLQSISHKMATALLQRHHSVVISSLAEEKIYAVHEPIAGIILAAGESTRFGRPKQLLDWKGQPFVRAVAQTAIRAGLSPVVVVTGSNTVQVEAAISDLNVSIVRNENWQSGQGSSIREGIKAITSFQTGGAIFLLSDQPQINTAIIHALVEKHAEGLHTIIAPMILDTRGNPVLFDRVTFSDLMGIEGDTGGRAIFHRYKVEYLPWHDDSLLLDVDTPEQYQRLINNQDL
jgi:molybdenum cofactor cytidylyltransferase